MSERQQFSSASSLSTEEGQEEEDNNSSAQQKHFQKRAMDPKKRAILKNLVKKNTLCHHLQIYTQANVICRRISYSYEEGK
ncbi:MAG: hypothetical protein M3270_11420, partial [Thermoproteota archaeon]|nr:hypothetical protein [Thermoproteota archaeon]